MFILTVLAGAAFWTGASAQNVTVKGRVLDEDNLPVPGATVMAADRSVKGGTITDAGGSFSISVPAGTVLKVSCIGYVDAERSFSKSGEWAVVLKEEALVTSSWSDTARRRRNRSSEPSRRSAPRPS